MQERFIKTGVVEIICECDYNIPEGVSIVDCRCSVNIGIIKFRG